MSLSRTIIDRTLGTPLGEAAYTIVSRLEDAGYDTWWVGGCVRDMLRGEIPDDIDIATAATPKEIMALFTQAKEIPRQLGSVRVRIQTHVFEITTYRKESKTSDGRIPESIEFSDRKEDAARRDFSINALYFHPISRDIFDPFNGQQDLEERLVRFIGTPHERIQHDALRILRAVRFKTRIEGQYHPETYVALRAHAQLVETLSGMRKLEEIDKLLLTTNSEQGFEDLWELGILQYIAPELYACKGIAQPSTYHQEGDVWNHLLQCVAHFQNDHFSDVRLAALLHDIGKVKTFSIDDRIRFNEHATVSAQDAKQLLMRLQAPSKRIEKIYWLIEHHMMMGSFTTMNDERKAHWYFHPWFAELLQLFWLDIAGTTPSDFSLYDEIVRDWNTFLDAHPRPITPFLDGKEIMNLLHIPPSPLIGELIDELYQAQVKKEVNDKKEAKEWILKKMDS